ncbi:MAG: LicD family protein [Lachnospiraceae bacterium]|nr:LicD family protein [Lachnospiraceae bacterium]
MNHSVDFFKDEIRNGFYVPTAIKQAWASTLDVLSEIDRICEKYGITYYADWGTLLGAVRHGGFIPWDDDLDICMKRDDYIRFRQVADKELPEHFDIHDYERHEDHWLFLARVVSNKKMCFEPGYLADHYNFPWLAGVDIFLKDYLYEDKEAEAARDREIMELLARANIYIEKKDRKNAIELYRQAEKAMGRTKAADTEHIGQIFPWVLKNGYSAADPKSYYEKTVRLPFEDTTIPVPAYYNKLLSKRYGEYCRVKKVWGGHDYPYFEAQKKEMEKLSGESLSIFKYDASMLIRPSTDRSNSLMTTASECLVGIDFISEQSENAYCRKEDALVKEYFQGSIQLARDYGTLVEQIKGENSIPAKAVVKCLEEYCEILYQSFSAYEKDGTAINFFAIGDHIEKIREATKEYLVRRKETVFVVTGPDKWRGMLPYYDRACAEDDTDIYVIPLPVMTRDYFGRVLKDNGISYSCNPGDYPGVQEEHLASWETYDISVHCPGRIYIQDPYDGANPFLTVPKSFYASQLRKYTDELIFVPFGKTSEFSECDINDIYNMRSYVTAPGIIYSDKVYVQSENIRNLYISMLTSLAGPDTGDIWDKKITVSDIAEMPSGKQRNEKHLLYCIGINEMIENPDIVNGIKKRFGIFDAAGDGIRVSIALYPHNRSIWKQADNSLSGEIFELIDKAVTGGKYRFLTSSPGNADSAAEDFDAYYGSPSPFVPAFNAKGKPVMISDHNV